MSHTAGARTTAHEVAALLAGLPQHGATIGNPDAAITLRYFGDLQCPVCRRFTLTQLTTLLQRYVRPGELRIEYHSLRTATENPRIFLFQQVAALAAGEQNKLWDFIELFYREQHKEDSGYVTEAYVDGLAEQVPDLNLISWHTARGDAALITQVARDAQVAREQALRSTPSFVIFTKRGTHDVQAIEKLLKS